jgi:hypothetical protein
VQLKVPTEIKENFQDRMERAYAEDRVLTLEHNAQAEVLFGQAWKDWKENYWAPRTGAISSEIRTCRATLKESTKYTVDLDNDFE